MDMEKVLRGLECCIKSTCDHPFAECEHCPYNESSIAVQECRAVLSADALDLLKEQEAQSVLSNRVCEVEPFRYVRKGFCPKCHQEMEWLFNRKHCGFCGQAVKWE